MNVKSLAAANVEEYTDDFIYDRQRDSIFIRIEEQYTKIIKQRLFDLEYYLVLSEYDSENDEMILVFMR